MRQYYDRLPLDVLHERGEEVSERFDADMLLGAADDVRNFNILLMEYPRVRRTLSNPGVPENLKEQLVRDLAGDRMTVAGREMCERLVSRRWPSPTAMLDMAELSAAWLFLLVADKQNGLERVEEELFRFWRELLAHPELTQVMEDARIPVQRRSDLMHALLDGRAHAITLRLLDMSISRPGGVPFLLTVERLVDLAAEVKLRRVAYVTSAVALTEEETERLARELGEQSGSEIDVKVTVDPDIIGGVIVRLGDQLIDGSVRRRLKDAQRELGRST